MLQGAHVTLNELLAVRVAASHLSLSRLLQISARQAGSYHSPILGRGMEFEEVRAYAAGDDMRTIDWRVTARTGKMHTKIFTEEKEQQVLLVVDQSPSMFFGSRKRMKSVAAAETAAFVIWTALQEGHRIGGLLFGENGTESFRPSSQRRHALQFMRSIQCQNAVLSSPHEQPGDDALISTLMGVNKIAQTRSLVFILSDFELLNNGMERVGHRLVQLAKRHNIILGLIYDELERDLPETGVFHLTDGERKQAVDAGNKDDHFRYGKHFRAKHDRLFEFSRLNNIKMLSLATSQDSKLLFLSHTTH